MRKNRKISKCSFMPQKLWCDFAKLNTNMSISLHYHYYLWHFVKVKRITMPGGISLLQMECNKKSVVTFCNALSAHH